jgi:predicted neutral ceramidase superfamily lipid hydrolase
VRQNKRVEQTTNLIFLLGWCLIGVMTIILFLAQNMSQDVNIWIKSSLTTISHTVWAIILVWLIYMSISDKDGEL